MSFNDINIRELSDSPVKMINEDWALLASGTDDGWNMMTVSWGGVGELWNKDVAFVFVRPQRYTYEFIEKNDYFSLSFFGGEQKKALALCGKVSGRDADKAKQTGLTPEFDDNSVYISQADTVLVCRKMAYQDLDPSGFIDPAIADCYNGDYHRMYIGEIVKVLKRK